MTLTLICDSAYTRRFDGFLLIPTTGGRNNQSKHQAAAMIGKPKKIEAGKRCARRAGGCEGLG
jgi:hypothetical protein